MKKQFIFISILIISCTVNAQESLVAYYPFNGNANDESGNGHNGTVFGATLAEGRLGNTDSCYYFDGNDYIRIDESSSFNVKSSGFTFSVWAKPDTGQNVTWANIASFGGPRQGGYRVLYIEPWGSLSVVDLLSNSSTYSRLGVDANHLNPEIWSMYTFTYKDGIYKLYFNGVLLEQSSATSYASSGNDLIIGASRTISDNFKGWVDEVRIYNRALTDMEVANLSGLTGAVRATELDAYAFSDFELEVLEPIKYSKWAIWGATNDSLSYIKVVENPVKSGSNTSDYVGTAVTFPTEINVASTPRKKEYVLSSEDGTAYDHHHIMQWKFLIPDSTLAELDTIMWDWMYFTQIYGGFGNKTDTFGTIAWKGGVFNDLQKVVQGKNPLEYRFRYRAMPDSAQIPFILDIGEWMTFTYDIFWTKSDTGYWRLYKNGELLSSRDNVQTLPDCAPEDGDQMHFNTCQYTKWDDAEIDSFQVYFDDIEWYIDAEATMDEICPECSIPNSTEAIIQNNLTKQVKIFPNPVKDKLTVQGGRIPSSITIYSIDGRKVEYVENSKEINLSHLKKGIYLATIKKEDTFTTVKFIKE